MSLVQHLLPCYNSARVRSSPTPDPEYIPVLSFGDSERVQHMFVSSKQLNKNKILFACFCILIPLIAAILSNDKGFLVKNTEYFHVFYLLVVDQGEFGMHFVQLLWSKLRNGSCTVGHLKRNPYSEVSVSHSYVKFDIW